MSDHQSDTPDSPLDPSRRRLLIAAGLASAGLGMRLSAGEVDAPARPIKAAEFNSAPPVAGLHLQFGADAHQKLSSRGIRCNRFANRGWS